MAFTTTNPVSVGAFTKKSAYDTLFDNTQELRGTSTYYNSAATQISTTRRYQICSGNMIGASIAALSTYQLSVHYVSIADTLILSVRRARFIYRGTVGETDLRLRIDYTVSTGAGSTGMKYTSSAYQGDLDANTVLCDNSAGGAAATGYISVIIQNSHATLARTPRDDSTYWLDLVMYTS